MLYIWQGCNNTKVWYCVLICLWGFWKSSGYLFAAQKNQAYFLLHLTTALPRSFCLAVNVDTSRMLYFKLFRQSHSPMELAIGWLVKIQGPCITFQMCSVQRLDLEVASHSSQKCDAGRGPPRSHAEGSQHWGWLTMLHRYSPTSAAYHVKREHYNPFLLNDWKRKLSPSTTLLSTDQRVLPAVKGRGDFWDLNTKLNWQALK